MLEIKKLHPPPSISKGTETMEDTKIYTRADLQNRKKEQQDLEVKRNAEMFANELRNAILDAASQGRQTYFRSIIRPESFEDIRYRIINSALDMLKSTFPDSSIKYNEQICLKTGKKINQGVYVDWS
jgi:hypothetical protein